MSVSRRSLLVSRGRRGGDERRATRDERRGLTMRQRTDSFRTRSRLTVGGATFDYFSLPALATARGLDLDRLPFSVRILLENLLRNEDGRLVREADVRALAAWDPSATAASEVPYMPARVLLQDFTGVPAVVDLAAMRSAMERAGRDPARIDPQIPVDLVSTTRCRSTSSATSARTTPTSSA